MIPAITSERAHLAQPTVLQSAITSQIKGYFVNRLAEDWGAEKPSPWHLRLFWALLRPFLGGA